MRSLRVACENPAAPLSAMPAYFFRASFTYNTRPLVPAVLVDGGDVNVIRRRQSYDEVIDLDTPLCEITSAGCEGSH
jgi:hypothetical protein